ncbi:MAG: autorepressor SdpR family transcription factor [Pseudomonadota bacterium]
MSTVFKALADPTRRQVLSLLKDGPLSAGEISEQFTFSKPTMSAHLSVLKEAGLVSTKKSGQRVIYTLQISVLEDAVLGFAEQFGLKTDERRRANAPRDAQGELS